MSAADLEPHNFEMIYSRIFSKQKLFFGISIGKKVFGLLWGFKLFGAYLDALFDVLVLD